MPNGPEIMASVRFLATDAGGRKNATRPDRLGCPFEFEGELFDCVLVLRQIGALSPGHDYSGVPIQFLCPEFVVPRLKIGSAFSLWEGRTIANGAVTEILPDTSQSRIASDGAASGRE